MEGSGGEKGEKRGGAGRGPQSEKNDPRHQIAGYGPVFSALYTKPCHNKPNKKLGLMVSLIHKHQMGITALPIHQL